MKRLQHADELLPEPILEGDPAGVEEARYQEHLLMLDVDTGDIADALGKVEHLRLREGFGGEPASPTLIDDRRVEALLDRGPDVERRGEVVPLHDEVGPVADADVVHGREKVVGGVPGEDI